MLDHIVISVFGTLITAGLAINGFLLRSIMIGQKAVEIDLAKLMVTVGGYSSRIDDLEHKFRKLEINYYKIITGVGNDDNKDTRM